jgi:hypothetical protein
MVMVRNAGYRTQNTEVWISIITFEYGAARVAQIDQLHNLPLP